MSTYTVEFDKARMHQLMAIIGIAVCNEDDPKAVEQYAHMVAHIGRQVGLNDPTNIGQHECGSIFAAVSSAVLTKTLETGAVSEEEFSEISEEAAKQFMEKEAKRSWSNG